MAYKLTRASGTCVADAAFWKKNSVKLRQPGELEAQIARIDHFGSFRRIFIMGCGRSGTWLLLALFSTYGEIDIIPVEMDVVEFGNYTTTKPALAFKRTIDSHKAVRDIPPGIEIVYIVRHPFDVLTSKHDDFEQKYYIGVERWLAEIAALQFLHESRRHRTILLKYEDIAAHPKLVQSLIAEKMNLSISHGVDQIPNTFKAPKAADVAMHGLRPIDKKSLHRYRDDPEKVAYLRELLPQLQPKLDWVAKTFGYDLHLPLVDPNT